MIVEANSLMMFGRQFGSNGGGADVASGATVMPLKKRKWDTRASLEASSRQSLEMSRARPMAPPGLSQRRSSGNFASNRASIEQGRSSIEVRASMDQRGSVDFSRSGLPWEEPACEAADDAEMGTIRENSDEEIIDLDEAGQEAEVTQKIDPGHLLSKLFSIGARNKATCMKIKGNDAEGFVVNKRFMDVMNLRESKQKEEMERLRQENMALRNANQTLSQKAMASQQSMQYAYPGVAPTMAYAQPVMHSSLYATQPQQYAQQYVPQQYATGPAWQYAPAP